MDRNSVRVRIKKIPLNKRSWKGLMKKAENKYFRTQQGKDSPRISIKENLSN
jgi:hypothetical protein